VENVWDIAAVEDPTVERIRRVYALFNDQRVLDRDTLSPDVEWHNAPELPGASVHHGAEAVIRDLQRQQEAWGESRFEPTEILPAGEDRYVVLLDVQVKGATSGATASIEGAHILTFDEGKVVRVQAFIDKDQALAAAGLQR
jgi:ketosteroid isomerase-like protein